MPRNRTTRARNRERYRALKRANGANDGTPKRGPSPYHERPAKTHPSRGGVTLEDDGRGGVDQVERYSDGVVCVFPAAYTRPLARNPRPFAEWDLDRKVREAYHIAAGLREAGVPEGPVWEELRGSVPGLVLKP
mgnify:CR=1 FL=1